MTRLFTGFVSILAIFGGSFLTLMHTVIISRFCKLSEMVPEWKWSPQVWVAEYSLQDQRGQRWGDKQNIAKGISNPRHWVCRLIQHIKFKAEGSTSFEILVKHQFGKCNDQTWVQSKLINWLIIAYTFHTPVICDGLWVKVPEKCPQNFWSLQVSVPVGNTDHTSLVVGVTTLVTCGATIYIVIALFRWVICINMLYWNFMILKYSRLNSFSQESNATKTRLVKINITDNIKCQDEVLNDNSQ